MLQRRSSALHPLAYGRRQLMLGRMIRLLVLGKKEEEVALKTVEALPHQTMAASRRGKKSQELL